METTNEATVEMTGETKFCRECGKKIAKKAVICPHCGCQVEEMEKPNTSQPQIVINNSNQNSNQNNNLGMMPMGREKNKWVALLLCFFLGFCGAHKFYEGKFGMGIIYIFTFGLFGFGVLLDFIALLFKRNPYYV